MLFLGADEWTQHNHTAPTQTDGVRCNCALANRQPSKKVVSLSERTETPGASAYCRPAPVLDGSWAESGNSGMMIIWNLERALIFLAVVPLF